VATAGLTSGCVRYRVSSESKRRVAAGQGLPLESAMPTSADSDLLARVETFAAEIVAAVRASVMEIVEEAIAEAGNARRPGSARASSARSPVRAKGTKRDPQVLQALTDELGTFIKNNPGQRIEQIAAALGAPTKDLVLPVRKLIAAKQIATKGQKRSTTYFPR
jgi:hypothetical protein